MGGQRPQETRGGELAQGGGHLARTSSRGALAAGAPGGRTAAGWRRPQGPGGAVASKGPGETAAGRQSHPGSLQSVKRGRGSTRTEAPDGRADAGWQRPKGPTGRRKPWEETRVE